MTPQNAAGTEESTGRRGKTALIFALAGALLLAPVAWGVPARLAAAQESAVPEGTPRGQVVAQGVAELPRGDVAWTVRQLDVPAAGVEVEAFPIGFAVVAEGTVKLQDKRGRASQRLGQGQSAYLPEGSAGGLAAVGSEPASVYLLALVPAAEIAAGGDVGNVVGDPFAAPDGDAFDIEISRARLAQGEELTIPQAASGAPVLFLLDFGTAQLAAPGGEPVEISGGQYALLRGEVIARGASAEPSEFVVVAIGEATESLEAAGTPEARAGRADRQRARAADGEATGGQARAPREQRQKRDRAGRTGGRGQGGEGGQGGQAQQPQEPGGAPVTGGVAPTAAPELPAGTPTAVPAPEATPPAEDSAEQGVETPTGEGTPPAATETVPDGTIPAGEGTPPAGDVPGDDTITGEETVTPEATLEAEIEATVEGEIPAETETITEEPPPVTETEPAAETVPEETPAVETEQAATGEEGA